jgi:hexosaminidase
MRPDTRARLHRPHAAIVLLAVALLGTACAPRVTHSLIPVPESVRLEDADSFTVDTVTAIAVTGGEEARRIGTVLAELIGNTVESTPPVVPAGSPDAAEADIALTLDPGHSARLGPEGYSVSVTGSGIRIEAAEPAGLFYGVQTFRQLLPPRVEYTAAYARPLPVPFAEIVDRPRFGWRGAMLDVSRHFFGVDDVKRYIDLLAMHKINRLHLHLADDQGWRIEIPDWPRLTEHGGSTEVGGGPGGFYTADDYRELVRYAADRFLTIVPEIDMPGHTNAALASYAELNCDGVAPELYTGTQVGFSALCVDEEVTYEFIDAVIGHLASITPGPWIHVGGDEVEELTEEEYIEFIERVQDIVESHGKRMVGWGEIAAAELEPHTLIQHWVGEGERLAEARAEQVILSPSERVYVDIQYHAGTPIGLSWPGLTPVRDSYDWEPSTFVPGLPVSAIAGLEAPLWTETVGTIHDIEYMAFPRIAAVAELAWSPAEATDWDDFRRRLARHGLRWTALGVNFYRSPDIDWERW